MSEFYTVVTQKGIETLTECMESGTAFPSAKMSVGDGNGSYYEITDTQTELKNAKYTALLYAKGKRNGYLFFNIQLPPSVGGFTIREVGLLDNEDNLLAIAKYPETYKQQAEDTSSKTILIEIQIKLSNEAFNTIIIDNSGELITREELTNEIDNWIEFFANLFKNAKIPDITNGEIYYTIIEDKNLENESVSAVQLKQEILQEVDNRFGELLQSADLSNLTSN